MLTYDLKVGYACNNKCKHCVIDDSKDRLIDQKENINLTTEECFSQIDEMVAKGIGNIILTGGEVTIRKDFRELIDKCVKHGLAITIQTNGRNLQSQYVVESIKDVENIRFVVALHGESDEVHDYITQVNGSFRETCDSIKKMCQLGKLVVIKVVISKINIKELPGIVKLVSSLGAKYICFAFPHGHGAARKNFKEVIPTYTELGPYLKELVKESIKENIKIELEAIPFCRVSYAMQLVGELKYYNGDTLCTHVKENTFDWSTVRKSIKKKGELCKDCDMDEFCEGVWEEYADAFGTEELRPIRFPGDVRRDIINRIKRGIGR